MPDPDGHIGLVTVSSDTGSVELDEPGEATIIAGQNNSPSVPEIKKEEDIFRDFSGVLAILPEQRNSHLTHTSR